MIFKLRSIWLLHNSTVATIVTNLMFVMVSLLVFVDPWHTFLRGVVGFSIYPFIFLLTLIFMLAVYAFEKESFTFAITQKKSFYRYSTVAACMMVLMISRFSTTVGWSRIGSSVIAPFMLGMLLGLHKKKINIAYFIFAGLLVKLVVLIPLAALYFQFDPKRPLFNGEAMYLLFGVGLDALAGVLIVIIGSLQVGVVWWIALLALPFVAFNLVGMNSRSLIFSSLLIGLWSVLLNIPRRRLASLAFLFFLTSVLAFSILLPGRSTHWEALLLTFLSKLGMITYNDYIDGSTEIRLDSIWKLLPYIGSHPFGHSISENEADMLQSHFFPLVLGYGTGYVGLILFSILWGGVIFRSIRLSETPDFRARTIGLFGVSISLQVGYLGLLFNSQVVFLLFGFILTFLVDKDKTKLLINAEANSRADINLSSGFNVKDV